MNRPVNSHDKISDQCAVMLDALSRAAAAVTGDLNLPRTLKTITDIARELVQARYAALGVPNDDGTLKAFTTSGMTPDELAHMGHQPRGLGLLGAVLESDEPIRLDNLTHDARSAGFCGDAHPADDTLSRRTDHQPGRTPG